MFKKLYSGKCFHAKLIMLGISFLFAEGVFASDNSPQTEKIWLIHQQISLENTLTRELRHPEAVELDSEGNLYIADSGSNRIVKLNNSFKIIAQTAGGGSSGDMMDNPRDICTYSGLNFFVPDYQNGRIIRLDRTLNYVWDIKLNSLNDMWDYPVDLTYSNWGELFILEENTGMVIRIESSNTASYNSSGFTIGSKSMLGAESIDVNPDGIVAVSIPADKKVYTFDRYGNTLRNISIPFEALDIDNDNGYTWICGKNELFCLKAFEPVEILYGGGESYSLGGIKDLAVCEGKLILLSDTVPYLQLFYLSKSPSEIKW